MESSPNKDEPCQAADRIRPYMQMKKHNGDCNCKKESFLRVWEKEFFDLKISQDSL